MKNGYIESKRSETDSDSYNIYIYIYIYPPLGKKQFKRKYLI